MNPNPVSALLTETPVDPAGSPPRRDRGRGLPARGRGRPRGVALPRNPRTLRRRSPPPPHVRAGVGVIKGAGVVEIDLGRGGAGIRRARCRGWPAACRAGGRPRSRASPRSPERSPECRCGSAATCCRRPWIYRSPAGVPPAHSTSGACGSISRSLAGAAVCRSSLSRQDGSQQRRRPTVNRADVSIRQPIWRKGAIS